VARQHLADGDNAFGAVGKAQHSDSNVFSHDGDRPQFTSALATERLRAATGVAGRNNGAEIGENFNNLRSSHVLCQVAGVRSDVGERGAFTAELRVEPPGECLLIGEPVLEVLTLNKDRDCAYCADIPPTVQIFCLLF